MIRGLRVLCSEALRCWSGAGDSLCFVCYGMSGLRDKQFLSWGPFLFFEAVGFCWLSKKEFFMKNKSLELQKESESADLDRKSVV